VTERVVDDNEAQTLLEHNPYRPPWTLP
jgi:hypothetical protein